MKNTKKQKMYGQLLTHKKTNVGAGPVSAHERGITLIALIITIIVMLILVGVTITIAIQGGLFNKAKEAKAKTDNAVNVESGIAGGTYNGRTIEDYVGGTTGATSGIEAEGPNSIISFKINGETFSTEQNLTWEQWIESPNSDGRFSLSDTEVCLNFSSVYYMNEHGLFMCYATDNIIPNAEYRAD